MRCGFCQGEFELGESRRACAGCATFGGGGCKSVRCPRCGYEMPEPVELPGFLKKLMEKFGGRPWATP